MASVLDRLAHGCGRIEILLCSRGKYLDDRFYVEGQSS